MRKTIQKCRFFGVVVAVIFVTSLTAFAASPVVEDFDSGSLDGWEPNTTQTSIAIQNTGGNPNGYLSSYTDGSWGIVGAVNRTASYTGDYASIRKASVDLSFVSGAFTEAWLRFRYHSGSYNGWKYPLTTSFSLGGWQTYGVIFDPFWTDGQAMAAGWVQEATSASFSETMADVYYAEVRVLGTGTLEIGIDNFALFGDCEVSTFDSSTNILHIPAVQIDGGPCLRANLIWTSGANFAVTDAVLVPCP